MNAKNPHTPRPLSHLPAQRSVLTARQLRAHGVAPGTTAERCRPGGPWQQVLPHVYLLHSGPPSSQERLEAALLYAGRDPNAHGPLGGGREAMVTGLAALAMRRFASVPPLPGLPRIDVLVARQRRLRDAGDVAIRRTRELPRPQDVTGLPCAPVPRALADAVAGLDDAVTVRQLLSEAVRGGHCDAAAVLHELARAGLLEHPHVTAAVHLLLAEGRAAAEDALFTMVRCQALPDPVWNVDLRLPGGPPLGAVDAYWPEHGVALEIDARTASAGLPGVGATVRGEGGAGEAFAVGGEYGYGVRGGAGGGIADDDVYTGLLGELSGDVYSGDAYGDSAGAYDHTDDDAVWSHYARQRERLEALGITVVHLTPDKLRDAPEQQAAVVRTALMTSSERTPPAYLVVTPR